MDRTADKLGVLEDIVHEAPSALQFAEWLIAHSPIPKREIMQCYMVWKFKWDWKEPDTNRAFERWAEGDRSYARAFAEVYDGRCSARTIYERVKERVRQYASTETVKS
jgi:hypothetical protein